jgi:hypothetical protein
MRNVLLGCGLPLTAATLIVAAGCGGGSFSASAAEGGTPEGGAEAGGEASADTGSTDGPVAEGSSHWCDSRPERFCEDFDEETDVNSFLSTWTTNQATNGSFSFDTSSTVPSLPNALQVNGTSGAQVTVVKTLPTLPQHEKKVTLAFELRINQSENISGLSAAGFAAIVYGQDLADGYVALAIGNGPALEAVGSAPSDAGGTAGGFTFEMANSGTFPAPATWASRYTLEIDFTQTPPCASVYAGTTALLAHCMALPSSLAVPTDFAIMLGDYSGGLNNTGTVDLEFDNVTFDAAY